MVLIECTEFDDDCSDVKDKWKCWNHSPENGFCPYLQSNIDIIRKRRGKISGREALIRGHKVHFKPGQACGHPGCLFHVKHPCEGCGRTGGYYPDTDLKC